MKKLLSAVLSVLVCAGTVSFLLPTAAFATTDSSGLDASDATTSAQLSTQSLTTSEDSVDTYAGDTMFETAVAEAKAAYPNGSSSAIIVGPGDAWIDALSATGLAGTKGPILFTYQDHLNAATLAELKDLGVKSVIITGGTAAVSDNVVTELGSNGITVEARLGGANAIGTQMAIYNYGKDKGYWNSDTVFVATSTGFGDALSASPIAYAKKAPIFLVDASGNLNTEQKQALAQASQTTGSFKTLEVLGGTAVVSDRTEGFMEAMAQASGAIYKRLGGATQYETSSAIATWAVDSMGFSWNYVAFATGNSPYDALAGSVLQGTSKSVLLLVGSTTSSTISTANDHRDAIDHIRFFGGTAAIPTAIRNEIISELTGDYTIMGNSQTTVDQMVAYYNAVANSVGKSYPSVYANYGAPTINDFCQIIYDEAQDEDVKAEVVFCQAMYETGWLQYGGDVSVTQCNFAGIGATGGVPGCTFPDVRTGLRAQIQHLKAYASTDDLVNDCVDPRFDYVTRGCAPTVESLSGKWAVPGNGYGDAIVSFIAILETF